MFLYSGTTPDFIQDTTRNAIANRLAEAFEAHFRFRPPLSEFQSWQNSLRCFADVLREGSLLEQGIFLEYQLPLSSKRLDAMVTGRDCTRDRAVIVELKQWNACEHGSSADLLKTWLGGNHRDVLHPSVQANQYRRYLEDMHTAFHEDEDRVALEACAYLHNYMPIANDPLFDERSSAVRRLAPVFASGSMPDLARHLSERLGEGDGERVLDRIAKSRYRPAKKLLAHVSKVISEEPAFVLIDEQQVVFSQVMATVETAISDNRKHVFLVHGGPGTGKSVLALNLLGALSGKGCNVQHATGSKAFTKTLQKIVGRQAGQQFRYFNNFGQAKPNDVDVVLCDEAHRLRATSNHRFTRPELRSSRPQIQEIIEAARVSVFFVDDKQIVRPKEIGSSEVIRDAAMNHGCVLHESWLETQFRCAGSDGFVNWVENTLEIRRTANVLFDQSQESFEFGIVDSPEELDALIRERVDEGHSARLVAGYCWPWSSQIGSDGELVKDVRIGDFERPWNARPDMTGLPRGVPRSDFWAYEAGGIEQVGCIYTAQGFEFDYVGVIWGRDLRYDPDIGWVGDRSVSHDTPVRQAGDRFIELVKNTYRVLLSRGMKGCFVYFEDPETEKFVRSRTENLGLKPKPVPARLVTTPAPPSPSPLDSRPFQPVRSREVLPWENAIPLLDLKVAAGDFTDSQLLEQEAVEWISLPDHIRIAPGYFVAQVEGESMNRRVPNGAWVLFSTDMRGSKQGRMVLARRHELGDPDDSGRYTLKLYEAKKIETEDGPIYESIRLRPDSSEERFKDIPIDLQDEERPTIAAWVVAILV